MRTVTVRAMPPEGFNGCTTPQRFWPEGARVVEVVDKEDDPILPITGKPDPYQIGQRTLRQLKSEENAKRFIVTDGGEVVRQEPTKSDAERLRDLESMIAKQAETIQQLMAEKASPAVQPSQQQGGGKRG